jgi:hypothetical protein
MQPLEEVKWRNIGFYQSGTELKAVVFDMSRVKPFEETSDDDDDDWVGKCVERLKERTN